MAQSLLPTVVSYFFDFRARELRGAAARDQPLPRRGKRVPPRLQPFVGLNAQPRMTVAAGRGRLQRRCRATASMKSQGRGSRSMRWTVAAHVLDARCRGPGKSSSASSRGVRRRTTRGDCLAKTGTRQKERPLAGGGPTLARYLLNVIGIGEFPSGRGRTCTCELLLIVRPILSGNSILRGVVGMLSRHTREYVTAEGLQLAGLLLPHHLPLNLSLHAGRFQVSKWM